MGAPATNPFGVVLPKSARLGELSASMDSLVKNISWELGERYDSVLSKQPFPLGPGWLDRLRAFRGDQGIRLHDPSFVFSEPEHHPDSVVWRALPERTPELVSQLRRARVTRNYWQHNAAEQNLNRFGEGVRRYAELCQGVGLSPTAEQCELLIERVSQIRSKGEIRTGPDPQLVEGIQERLRVAELEAERAQKDLAELLLAQEQNRGAHAQERQELLEEVELQREALGRAQDEVRELGERVRGMLQEQRLRLLEPAADLTPGDEWTGPALGVRLLDLQPKMVDLVDLNRKILLSDEIGAVANEAAQRWLQFMPAGGQVHMSEGGHAAGLVAGRWVYLGRLDTVEPPISQPAATTSRSPSSASAGTSQGDQLVGYMYELTPDSHDVFEYTTEKKLSEFLGAADARSVAEHLAGDISVKEVFWTRLDGSVLIRRAGLMHKASEVDLDYWFPYRGSTSRAATVRPS